MATDPSDFSEEVREPGWGERFDSVKRAAKALFSTRAEIFKEELAEKGSIFGSAAAGFFLALAFALLALVLATALVAAVLSRVFGGPIAGIGATLVLYLLIAGGAAFFGLSRMRRLRPFEFPATRDELKKDLDAIREEGTDRDSGSASPEVLAAERASIRPGEPREERQLEEPEEREEEATGEVNLEERFRAGSE